jgi:hypothetical protein
MKNKYSICIAERLECEQGDRNDNWYHTFLLLVNESTDPVTIAQQLHYNDNALGHLLPNVRRGISDPEKFKNIMISRVETGEESEILKKWNYALSYAFYLKYSAIPFGENYKHGESDVNCRAAVIATLKILGIGYNEDDYAQSAGTVCAVIPVGVSFNEMDTTTNSERTLWQKNDDLLRTLDAEWIPQKRYMGPVKYPLLPMKKTNG